MTAQALIKAANEGKSVTGINGIGCGRTPAAFVVSMQFRYVMNRLNQLEVYKPRKKDKFSPAPLKRKVPDSSVEVC